MKNKKLEAESKAESKKKLTLSDPERADRKIELNGLLIELKAGELSKEVELTASQAKELKEKYPYLLN